MTTNYFSHLECADSGERVSGDKPQNNTCAPGDILVARYHLERLVQEVSKEHIMRGPSSLWRYAPMLPVAGAEKAVTLSEGWTPLLHLPALGRLIDAPNLYLKDESRNPSGTFKDRGSSVAISRLRELGVRTVALNSSGNAGASWALYAARAGMRCVNLVPNDVLPASLQQSVLAGANTFVLDGLWEQAGAMVRQSAKQHGWFNCNTLQEPYRVEGKKTIGYEICEQLDWELPDVVILPTGGALGAVALFKAFDELRVMGWVDRSRLPRLIVTQYEGCAPIVKAFKEGSERAEPWTNLDVLPGGLKSPMPPGDKAVLRILRATGGTAIAVSTEEALKNVEIMTRTEGVFPCPESATALSGLTTCLARGDIQRQEKIVLINTGSGLKSIPNLPEARCPLVRAGESLPDTSAATSQRG